MNPCNMFNYEIDCGLTIDNVFGEFEFTDLNHIRFFTINSQQFNGNIDKTGRL